MKSVNLSVGELDSPSATDWKRLEAMTDEDIDLAIAADPDAAPSLPAARMREEYHPAPARLKR